MTVDELEDLKRVWSIFSNIVLIIVSIQIASGHLAHRHYDDDMDREDVPKTKKRKVGTRIERPRGVAEQFRQTDISGVQEVSYHIWYECLYGYNIFNDATSVMPALSASCL